ncbi:MAG: hypothetical protein UT32_C0028G0030 [Parcubacteria group bacterium GW2011_GWC2_39_14]|nr:MAG: hypothetical protein UT32_C0028G0030 [Parcubacteria group bacterium GW2011_GWC2_39_14]KKR53402.1 MAG: hypothetical protein UT91_C0028G0007 [Parcubacteria group bacterium GW2011_GWA2_40_23]
MDKDIAMREWSKRFRELRDSVSRDVRQLWRMLIVCAPSKRVLRRWFDAEPVGVLPANMTPERDLIKRFESFWDFLHADESADQRVRFSVLSDAQLRFIFAESSLNGIYLYYWTVLRQIEKERHQSILEDHGDIGFAIRSGREGLNTAHPQFLISVFGQKHDVRCVLSADKSSLCVCVQLNLHRLSGRLLRLFKTLPYGIRKRSLLSEMYLEIFFFVPYGDSLKEVVDRQEALDPAVIKDDWHATWTAKEGFATALLEALKAGPIPMIESVEAKQWGSV